MDSDQGRCGALRGQTGPKKTPAGADVFGIGRGERIRTFDPYLKRAIVQQKDGALAFGDELMGELGDIGLRGAMSNVYVERVDRDEGLVSEALIE